MYRTESGEYLAVELKLRVRSCTSGLILKVEIKKNFELVPTKGITGPVSRFFLPANFGVYVYY